MEAAHKPKLNGQADPVGIPASHGQLSQRVRVDGKFLACGDRGFRVQAGYKCDGQGGYLSKSLPPLEFTHTEATIDETFREIDPESPENLPYGLHGNQYRWVDLHGEGLSGILTEQAGSWFYKQNLSPVKRAVSRSRVEQGVL
jgi:hypothetical protein